MRVASVLLVVFILLMSVKIASAEVGLHPDPRISLEIIKESSDEIILKVKLVNYGDIAENGNKAGIHLRVVGGHFAEAGAGDFNGVTAYDASDPENPKTIDIQGSKVIEFYRWGGSGYWTELWTGEIKIIPESYYVELHYRAWTYDEDDEVWNPYCDQYEYYIARDPEEEDPGNPPYNRHVCDPESSFLDYWVYEESWSFVPPNKPPVAKFTYSPTTIYKGQEVTFDASGSYDPDGTIVSYKWSFGDGITATGKVVTHRYERTYNPNWKYYTVCLEVTDNDGSTDKTCQDIVVFNHGPSVTIEYPKPPFFINREYEFKAWAEDPDGDLVEIEWYVDGRYVKDGEDLEYKFTEPGSHEVKAVAIDEEGAKASHSIRFAVLPFEEEVFKLMKIQAEKRAEMYENLSKFIEEFKPKPPEEEKYYALILENIRETGEDLFEMGLEDLYDELQEIIPGHEILSALGKIIDSWEFGIELMERSEKIAEGLWDLPNKAKVLTWYNKEWNTFRGCGFGNYPSEANPNFERALEVTKTKLIKLANICEEERAIYSKIESSGNWNEVNNLIGDLIDKWNSEQKELRFILEKTGAAAHPSIFGAIKTVYTRDVIGCRPCSKMMCGGGYDCEVKCEMSCPPVQSGCGCSNCEYLEKYDLCCCYIRCGAPGLSPDNDTVKLLDFISNSLRNDLLYVKACLNIVKADTLSIETDPPVEVDIHLYDSKGRHVGAIYDAEGNVIGVEVEIPNAYYSGWNTTPEYIVVVNPSDEYRLEIVGKETGTYDLRIERYDEGSLTFNETYEKIPITVEARHEFSVSPEEEITEFKPMMNIPPSANANGPYEGYEGAAIKFNASASYDLNEDYMLYRWDFDDDGVWDTDWLNNPFANYTYGDDYLGYVKLEVTDEELNSTDYAHVEIHNVPPIVKAENVTVQYSDSVQLNGSFYDPGWLDTHTVEWDLGDGSKSSELKPVHRYLVKPGNYTAVLTVKDDDRGVGQDSITVTVLKEDTVLKYLGDTRGQYSDSVTLIAQLTEPDEELGDLSNKTIIFRIGNQTVEATTNETGYAVAVMRLWQPAGNYTVEAIFEGDEYYKPSNDSKPFTIEREDTVLIYTGDIAGQFSDPVKLKAILTEPDEELGDLSSKPIEFEIGIQNITALTKEEGIAEAELVLWQIPGNYTLNVTFEGDEYYKPSKNSTSFLILKENVVIDRPYVTIVYSDEAELTVKARDDDGQNLFHQQDYPKKMRLEYFKDQWKLIATDVLESPNDTDNELYYFISIPENLDEPAGNYTLRVKFDGDPYYNSSISEGLLTILKETVVIEAYDAEGFFNDTIALKALILDDDGERLLHGPWKAEFSIDGRVVGEGVINESGYAVVSWIVDLVPIEILENHTITVTYEENEYYKSAIENATFTLKSAKWLKIDAVRELSIIVNTTTDKRVTKDIEKAIELINESLDPVLWIDASRIDPKEGHKVFDREKHAVKELLKIVEKRGRHAEPTIANGIEKVIKKIVKADELLALVAIYDAKNTPVNPQFEKQYSKQIAKAEKELAKAYEALAQEDYDKAIDHFRKAWKHAQLAIKFVQS